MKRRIPIALLFVFLGGCVSTRNATVGEERTHEWRGKSVALTVRPRADFVAMTAGKAAFALIGAVAMIKAGKAIVAKNGVEAQAPTLATDPMCTALPHYSV